MPHRRTHQAATQRATPIVGPRSQGRPSPYSRRDYLNAFENIRADMAGSAGRPRKDLPPRGFRDQPTTPGRGYRPDVPATFPRELEPEVFPGSLPQTRGPGWTMSNSPERQAINYGTRLRHGPGSTPAEQLAQMRRDAMESDPRFLPAGPRSPTDEESAYLSFPPPRYGWPSGNRFGAPAEDPGLYNLYRMMMGRRRRNPIGQRPYRPESVRPQIMPEYRVDPRIDPYPTG